MSTVPLWSGREVRSLREARRMSVREFAAHLGISDRMVSKWEAGGEAIRPRPLNQAALDTSLALASSEVRSRFTRIAIRQTAQPNLTDDTGSVRHLVRHPLDGKLMTLIEAGPVPSSMDRRAVWLPAYYIDVHATTRAEFERFLAATAGEVMANDFDGTDSIWLDGGGVLQAVRVEQVRRPRRKAGQAELTRVRSGQRHRTLASAPLSDPAVPAFGIGRDEAKAYALWATKTLPSAEEWDRAHRGPESVISSGIAEWCRGPVGVVRRGRGRERTGFRCTTTLAEMLALLAI